MGELVRPGRRYRQRNGVYVIALTGRDVLLTFQHAPVPEVQLPGGGIDAGEPPLRALHREVMEETGWRIAEPQRLGAYRRFSYMPEYEVWAEKVCTVYLARAVRRLGDPSEAGHTAFLAPLPAASSLVASAGDSAYLARVAASDGGYPIRPKSLGSGQPAKCSRSSIVQVADLRTLSPRR